MKFKYTQSVEIRRNTSETKDPFGGKSEKEYETETVDNCVIVPTAGTEALENTRPDGFKIVATLHLPKTYTKPLQGAEVFFQGTWLTVAGDNFAYPDNCPTEWNRNVTLGVKHG